MDDKILLEKAKELIELKYELDTLMSKMNDLKQDIIQDIKNMVLLNLILVKFIMVSQKALNHSVEKTFSNI
ncbi:hypothetical protein [Aeromonas sp. S9(2024)]|uniref:hypothetical protein n=1 Tax=Aeromonas sp. S9(2024) TaxID=3242882 RepID=UPI0035287C71